MTRPQRTIDLLELTKGEVRSLIGHERGLAARAKYELDDLDEAAAVIEILIPSDFRAVSPSFFQGMFGKSVHKYGDIDNFLQHYQFTGPTSIVAKIIEYARETLLRRTH